MRNRVRAVWMLGCAVALLAVLATQAAAGIPYWQVNEHQRVWPQDPNGTHVWFEVTNIHQTDAITGFAVGTSQEAADTIMDRGTATDWMAEIVSEADWTDDHWSWMTSSPDSTIRKSGEWFYGDTWGNIFGDAYSNAIMYWSQQQKSNDIPAGETWELHGCGEGVYGSPAVVSTKANGGLSGERGAANYIPVSPGPIPEPATMLLLDAGLTSLSLKLRRRRCK